MKRQIIALLSLAAFAVLSVEPLVSEHNKVTGKTPIVTNAVQWVSNVAEFVTARDAYIKEQGKGVVTTNEQGFAENAYSAQRADMLFFHSGVLEKKKSLDSLLIH